MPFIIYNPETKKYRSYTGNHDWDTDINNAAIFRTEENARLKIVSFTNIWKRYKTEWKDHPTLPIAIEHYENWKDAVVKECYIKES